MTEEQKRLFEELAASRSDSHTSGRKNHSRGYFDSTKHKGLDDKKCEALLLDSLKDHGSLTKPEIVRLLWDVLPDQLDNKQKNNKLDYLLKKTENIR